MWDAGVVEEVGADLGRRPGQSFEGLVADLEEADPVRCAGGGYAGEDRFVVRSAVAESLDV